MLQKRKGKSLFTINRLTLVFPTGLAQPCYMFPPNHNNNKYNMLYLKPLLLQNIDYSSGFIQLAVIFSIILNPTIDPNYFCSVVFMHSCILPPPAKKKKERNIHLVNMNRCILLSSSTIPITHTKMNLVNIKVVSSS